MADLKPYDLQEWNSKMGPKDVFVKTHIWGKTYPICEGEKIKLLAQKQLPGTYFKIVDAVTKKTVQETKTEARRLKRQRERQAQLQLSL